MDKLKQRRLLEINEFKLEEKGLNVKRKRLGEYVELTIPYEEITKSITVVKVGNKRWFYAGVIFIIISLTVLFFRLMGNNVESFAEIIWLIIGLICLSIFAIKYKSYKNLMCTDGKVISFFQDKPNKETLDLFIDNLLNRRNDYLKEKYSKIDVDFPIEHHLYRIKWLKDEEIINDDEFNEIKKRLIEGKKAQNINIGFKVE